MLAIATQSIAWVIFTISLVGWIAYYLASRRAARS
ncbi:MAG: hypothetical protein RI958_1522, partial [Actinomycetota bacterium]